MTARMHIDELAVEDALVHRLLAEQFPDWADLPLTRSSRARGWVLSQAVAALAYYTPENNPARYNAAKNWLDLVMSEPS
jgi:hypothetical protein